MSAPTERRPLLERSSLPHLAQILVSLRAPWPEAVTEVTLSDGRTVFWYV